MCQLAACIECQIAFERLACPFVVAQSKLLLAEQQECGRVGRAISHRILQCLHGFLWIGYMGIAVAHAQCTVGTLGTFFCRDALIRAFIVVGSLIVFAHSIELLTFLEVNILVAASHARGKQQGYTQGVPGNMSDSSVRFHFFILHIILTQTRAKYCDNNKKSDGKSSDPPSYIYSVLHEAVNRFHYAH